jgi:hypothetical protein
MKWVDYEKMSVAAVSDPHIEQVLRDQTLRVFKTLEGNGYARCDYRMDSDRHDLHARDQPELRHLLLALRAWVGRFLPASTTRCSAIPSSSS